MFVFLVNVWQTLQASKLTLVLFASRYLLEHVVHTEADEQEEQSGMATEHAGREGERRGKDVEL